MSRGKGYWDTCPPSYWAERWLHVDRCDAGETWTGWLLGDNLFGRFLHSRGGPKQPCPGEDVCLLCKAGLVKHWYGFIQFLADGEMLRELIMEIPSQASQSLQMVLAQRKTLAGLRVELSRNRSKKNNAVKIRWCERAIPELAPNRIDIRPILDRMFGRIPSIGDYGESLIRDEIAEAID